MTSDAWLPPTVSVVIPTYNQATTLPATLAAVAAQSMPPREVVVVDDGSTDHTPAVLADIARNYPLPLVIRRQANAGPGPARDLGWRTATGSLIAYTDSDALPHRDWLEAALPYFTDPSVAAVEGRVTAESDRAPTIWTHQVKNLFGGQFMTANMIYRRRVIAEVGGFKTRHREDSDLAFSVLERHGRIVFAPRAVVEHPPREESLAFYFRVANRRRYEGGLLRRHPTVAPQYVHRLQPTGPLVVLGELLVLFGLVHAGWPVTSLGLACLVVGLPKRVLAWLDGRSYSYRDYLTVLIVSLALVPVETYHQWLGLIKPPRHPPGPAAD
ncbi:MAG: glycosyltransferase family A protein [Thermaerobacter sp.]|nr:glycosyltransferase family A protein [Thermaerobacter sp.]